MGFATNIYDTMTRMTSETNRVNFEKSQANLGSSTLNKDAFMQLLLAQLQNQDPLSPVDNSQFLSQQAQLAQVEQMDNLTKTMQSTTLLTQASTIVGKTVDIQTGNNPETGEPTTITGKISSANISPSGEVNITVNDENFSMRQVRKIYGDILQ